jgi:aminomethyltransferase
MTIADERPQVLVPGLLPTQPGRELHRVHGGGATVLHLDGGDQLVVTDIDGGQRAELLFVDPDGAPDFAAVGAQPDGPADGLAGLAAAAQADAAALTATLGRRFDPAAAAAVRLFGPGTRYGESVALRAERAVTCVVVAPAAAMRIDEQNPPSDLALEVWRATAPSLAEPRLPAPLAEPSLDLRVDRASAISYEVKAGEFVQIIDIEGRQCSDFLAFDARRLEAGMERGLDATATRTFMGRAYPAPGLYSKFFDEEMRPLVEVVRDTVGRHDTFGLACNTKYYEDMGYFGHINCTDNFNQQLAPYGIAPRAGWPAINFFYNSRIDDANVLILDEPWSRPGDYVLLRALTDLVCASSACPDDIDPSNGWNPTEIHLRVYPATQRFSQAIAHRVTPDAEPVLTKETGFAPRIRALTRRMTEYRGYWLPTSFSSSGPEEEYWACRERAAVMDLSPLRKFEVLGPDAETLLQATVTRNIRKLSVNQVVYTAMCTDTGGMIDDATVFRLGADNFRFVGGDDYDGVWLRQQAERLGLDRVWVRNSTDQIHNLAVQGPASRDLLRSLVWTPDGQPSFDELTWFRFTVGRLGGQGGRPILASRTGYSGELGYELWCHPSDALTLWDAVWAAGQPFGLRPLGLDALDVLRIEAGLVFSGYEFDDQVDPFEAGIGFSVALSKDDDFVGRTALERRKASPQRILVGLELDGNEPAAHGDCVHVGRPQVGVVTSGTRSPILRKNIALCRIALEYAEPGTPVEVGKLDGHQKRIAAQVVRLPFYDPDKIRPRS